MTQPTQQNNNGRPAAVDENAPIGSVKNLYGALDRWAPQISDLAPKGKQFDFARFKAVVMSCATRVPKVLLCSSYSIRQAVQAASELGLELGGVSGEAFLIPFENRKKIVHPNGASEWISVLEATFIPGYKGYLRLAYESGLFRDLGCDVILPDDHWEPIRRGPDKLLWGHVQGEPKSNQRMMVMASRWVNKVEEKYEASVPAIRGAYAYAKLTNLNSDDIVKPIWLDRLEEIRQRSKAGMNGPWISDHSEMSKKTAVRNLWKHIPKNDRMNRAEELDQEFDLEPLKDGREPRGPEVITVTPQTKTEAANAKTSRVAEKVAAKVNVPPAPETPKPASSRPANEPPNHDGDEPTHERQPGEEG